MLAGRECGSNSAFLDQKQANRRTNNTIPPLSILSILHGRIKRNDRFERYCCAALSVAAQTRLIRRAFEPVSTELNTRNRIFVTWLGDEGSTMQPSLFSAAVVGIVTVITLQDAAAEQRQLRPVTITFKSNSVTRTQWTPDSPNPITTSTVRPDSTTKPGTNPVTGTRKTAPGISPTAVGTQNYSSGFARPSANGDAHPDGILRPSNQQIQNPSGEFQLTHVGITHPASIAPNNYFGPEFNGWSNLQMPSGNLDAFESFNRTQPDINSGGHYSPNTYVGSANSDWSNLSSGSLSANDLGGWNFRP